MSSSVTDCTSRCARRVSENHCGTVSLATRLRRVVIFLIPNDMGVGVAWYVVDIHFGDHVCIHEAPVPSTTILSLVGLSTGVLMKALIRSARH